MSTIKETARLLKRGCLTNVCMPNGKAITMLISGAHGLGKTNVVHEVAKDLGGVALVVEGGSLKEGEITGLPFSDTNPDGTKEVRFVPYYQTGRIQHLEKAVLEKAKTTGFLNGAVKLNENGDTVYKVGKEEVVIPAKSTFEQIITGTENNNSFGEELPADIKLQLLKSKEIIPVILFVDEINRTDSQTMKELMNIVLTRTVNGYKFPWWVFIVSAVNPCGQDSVYATNEMDDAQLDRFLKVRVEANINEWVEYAIDNNINQDYIVALGSNDDLFATTGKGYDDSSAVNSDDDLKPTPRSHEICSHIYGDAGIINDSGFLTQEEIGFTEADIRTLICGKIGTRAGRAMLSALKNRENFIDPAELFTGKTDAIKDTFKTKIEKMRPMAQRVLCRNVARWFATQGIKPYCYKLMRKGSTEDLKKNDELWAHTVNQLKTFIDVLVPSMQVICAKDICGANIKLTEKELEKYNVIGLFSPLSSVFTFQVIEQLGLTSSVVKTGDIDKK